MTTVSPPTVPTPPPVPPASGGSPRPSGPRTSSRVVSVVVAAVGGVIVLGALATVALSTVALANRQRDETAVSVGGVDQLDIDVSGGSLTVTYGDVSEAELVVDRGIGSGPWTLENRDGTLTVASPDHAFSFGWPFGGSGDATLRLPASLRASAVDGAVEVDGGSVSLTGGRFDQLHAVTDAGSLRLSGIARTVTAQSDAGDSTLDLANVDTADLDVSAGRMVARLGGTAPGSVEARVSAGVLDLGVPDQPYVVTSSVSAGAFHNSLGSTPGATNTIRAEVSAGALTIHALGR